MTPEEIKTLATICDLLRAKGVKEFEGAGIRVILNAVDEVATSKPVSLLAADACRCGHAEYQHGPGGLCLQGCEAEQCLNEASLAKAKAEQ